jgi:hypothetical protein
MDIEMAIKERFQNIEWALDERMRRLFAATEAKTIGHGGITIVWKATGVARGSIQQGLKELVERPENIEGNIRRIPEGNHPSKKMRNYCQPWKPWLIP